jgi:DNA-binding MarR family transcriptional regulator
VIISIADDQLWDMLRLMPRATTNTPDAGKRPPELTDTIGYLLKHAQQRFQEIQRQALTPLRLDGRLLAVLITAGHAGPCQQLRLAEKLGVDRTTMVDLVDRLEALGFVERHADPNDRRARLIHLTTRGRKALAAGVAASHEVEQRFLAAVSDADQRTFRRTLGRLA